jgi:hypothetical protein
MHREQSKSEKPGGAGEALGANCGFHGVSALSEFVVDLIPASA